MKVFKSFNQEVVELLKNGAVGVIPTDTVYGIVTPLSNESSVKRIYKIKKRSLKKPVGTILIDSTDQIKHITDQKIIELAKEYWPGPTSVILPVDDALRYAHCGYDSLPFRIPDQVVLRNVLKATGPLATSSANTAGELPAADLGAAQDYFGEQVDFYVDGGDLHNRSPSSIIEIEKSGHIKKIR